MPAQHLAKLHLVKNPREYSYLTKVMEGIEEGEGGRGRKGEGEGRKWREGGREREGGEWRGNN